MTPASGTIYRASSTGRGCTPSPWAAATPWSRGPAPWGSWAEARPHLDSAWGPHGQPQGLAHPLPREVPSRGGLPGPAESPRGASHRHKRPPSEEFVTLGRAGTLSVSSLGRSSLLLGEAGALKTLPYSSQITCDLKRQVSRCGGLGKLPLSAPH